MALNCSLLFISLLLAAALQVQVDLFEIEKGYIGLRLNLGDLLVPLAGLGILKSLIARHSAWPKFRLSGTWVWLCTATILMTFALFQGYLLSGEWSRWGLFNKYIGWFVLMSLFLWGSWLRANFEDGDIVKIFKIFSWTALAIMFTGLPVLFLRNAGIMEQGLDRLFNYPFAGLMANRNSYALFLCMFTIILSVFNLRGIHLVPPKIFTAFWIIAPMLFLVVGSRSSWICAPFILTGLLVYGRKETLRKIFLPLLIGVMAAIAFSPASILKVTRNYQIRLFNEIPATLKDDINFGTAATQDKYYSRTDALRIQAARDAVAVWKDSPLIGGGLGSFLRFQEDKYGHFLDVIDNSALWLIAEMGITGFITFAVFYFAALLKLWRDPSPLSRSMFGIMLVFAFMSLFHEILYTRYIWFLLGLSLALPRSESVVADERAEPVEIDIRSA